MKCQLNIDQLLIECADREYLSRVSIIKFSTMDAENLVQRLWKIGTFFVYNKQNMGDLDLKISGMQDTQTFPIGPI